jgi:hypothetical protein
MFPAQQDSKQLVFADFHRLIVFPPGLTDNMNCEFYSFTWRRLIYYW